MSLTIRERVSDNISLARSGGSLEAISFRSWAFWLRLSATAAVRPSQPRSIWVAVRVPANLRMGRPGIGGDWSRALWPVAAKALKASGRVVAEMARRSKSFRLRSRARARARGEALMRGNLGFRVF
jgi:hypothetical protein